MFALDLFRCSSVEHMRENEKRKHRVIIDKKCVVLIALFGKTM